MFSKLSSSSRRVLPHLPSSSSHVRVLHRSLSSTASNANATATAASPFAPLDTFARRHLGPSTSSDISKMLSVIRASSLDELINQTVPSSIRLKQPLKETGAAQGESKALEDFKRMMDKNKVATSFIGQGYYNTITPPVILRNILENPAWYTPYTPYQAEIAQGRLEMLLNFQTMISDLTGLPVSNSSLLDEGTAGAEAMNMAFGMNKADRKTFLISSGVHPQTIAVCKTRAAGIGVNVEVFDKDKGVDFEKAGDAFGVLIQYPDTLGRIDDYKGFTEKAHKKDIKVIVATDILALTILQPPGEWYLYKHIISSLYFIVSHRKNHVD